MSETYSDPVAQLLTLGHPDDGEDLGTPRWFDYLALGLAAKHVPELVRLALDADTYLNDSESPAVWASLHAWRALGQLRAESAIDPLLQLLDRVTDDDWIQMDLPKVFGKIGPAAIPGLQDFLADAGNGEWSRITAIDGLIEIVKEFPETRERVIDILTDQLRHFAEQDRGVNAFLIARLCNMRAVESAGVIEQAFAAGNVDLSVLGDWEEAQILLGLIEERVTPWPNFFQLEYGSLDLLGGQRV